MTLDDFRDEIRKHPGKERVRFYINNGYTEIEFENIEFGDAVDIIFKLKIEELENVKTK